MALPVRRAVSPAPRNCATVRQRAGLRWLRAALTFTGMAGFPLSLLPVLLLAARGSSDFSWRFGFALQPLLALLAGLLILLRPKLLHVVVAVYLILAGILGLFHVSIRF